jgi:hypothetical protein
MKSILLSKPQFFTNKNNHFMELIVYNPSENGNNQNNALTVAAKNEGQEKPAFIEANTSPVPLQELKEKHIIPTYKDSTPLISHADFVEVANETVHQIFAPERITAPEIRVSHPILGRIPEAKDKPVKELFDHEKTIYYERAAFIIELPSISDNIGGQQVSMTIGGVRKYDGSSLRSGADQCFKIFAGYSVKVCTNLCVWTDGLLSNVKVKTIQQLREAIYQLLCEYDAIEQLKRMEAMLRYSLTEQQFAQLLGKARLYQYLPSNTKQMYPEFLYTDTMLNQVARDYYSDSNFGREFNGDISLRKVYNLLTASNKSSYIDLFLQRAANASSFVGGLASSLEQGSNHWFLS